ncbi:glutamyl-tRNA(Gln) amidotransferase subunit D [Nanobdella aerobiophila]|uniref:Glutamyl-tRNA(Gln) amidotransferase subunit D n=1 Tax=Nanobdella aerobiophila TaxID=2586965 RepID=A0A915SKP1_9ARCH|nr:Glu-tRNA(Gln) amidotransferase subunit GatD [Nanobdella aerobiophila]BBL45773.1 glutamyl-tRNA(Gln) amidotransferase subunit D [Nanobdella aerobiophila]
MRYVNIKTKDNKLRSGYIINETSDFIIIKLKNGYNIGIYKEDIIDIEQKEIYDTKKEEIRNIISKNNKKISIIATGGTILSKIDYRTGGVHMLTNPEELIDLVPDLLNYTEIKNIEIPFSIASEDMLPDNWIEIGKKAVNLLKDNENNGITVLHGTDTMHYTSAALSFIIKNLNKPIALTGSQRSSDRPSSDAFFNLLSSAIYNNSDIAEVSVVMHGSSSDKFAYAHRGTKVRKMHTERRDAFQSINDLPIAKIYPLEKNMEIINNNYVKRNNNDPYLDDKIEKKVALIKVYPGSDPDIVKYYIDKNYRGIVLEGTGFGHVPTNPVKKEYSWIDNIKEGIKNNMVFVIASQTIYGRTNPFVYTNGRLLYDLGVIYSQDMTPEVSLVKLMYSLGHADNYDEVKKIFLSNIAGEINEKSHYEYFNVL